MQSINSLTNLPREMAQEWRQLPAEEKEERIKSVATTALKMLGAALLIGAVMLLSMHGGSALPASMMALKLIIEISMVVSAIMAAAMLALYFLARHIADAAYTGTGKRSEEELSVEAKNKNNKLREENLLYENNTLNNPLYTEMQ